MCATVTIDDDLLRRACAQALASGRSLGDVVDDGLRVLFGQRDRGPRVGHPAGLRWQWPRPGVDLEDKDDRTARPAGRTPCCWLTSTSSSTPTARRARTTSTIATGSLGPLVSEPFGVSRNFHPVLLPAHRHEPTRLLASRRHHAPGTGFCRVVRGHPAVVVHPGSRHWRLFAGLVAEPRPAQLTFPTPTWRPSLDVGATWITTDRASPDSQGFGGLSLGLIVSDRICVAIVLAVSWASLAGHKSIRRAHHRGSPVLPGPQPVGGEPGARPSPIVALGYHRLRSLVGVLVQDVLEPAEGIPSMAASSRRRTSRVSHSVTNRPCPASRRGFGRARPIIGRVSIDVDGRVRRRMPRRSAPS